MQTLSATLLAAQKKARGKPIFKVQISDKIGPHDRLRWTKLYSNADPDEPHSMIVCKDHSIVRVRSHAGVAQYQRITDPTVEAQWTTWTGGMGTCSIMNQMALSNMLNYGTRVWWFYTSASDMILYCRESTDCGQTWGSATTIHTCTGNYRLESIASAYRGGNDPILFYSVHNITVTSSCHLYWRKRITGTWGGATSWGKTGAVQIRGLTCHKTSNYNIIFGANVDAYTYFGIGDAPGLAYMWALFMVEFGSQSDVWYGPVLIDRTDAGTAFATAWPSLTFVGIFRAVFTGYLVGEEYSRLLRMSALFDITYLDTTWTDPWPFLPDAGTFGSVIYYLPYTDGYIYLSHSNAAYRSPDTGDAPLDLGARLVKYKIRDRWAGHKAAGVALDYGQLTAPVLDGEIWLDNHDGALNALGTGTYAAIKRGCMLELSRGYHTTDGDEYAPWPTMWVEDYEHVVDFQGRHYVALYCIGGWGITSTMALERQYHWQDGDASVWTIAERLFALASFNLSSKTGEASAASGTLEPALVLHPGQDLRGAILQAISKVPDFVYWEQNTPYLKQLTANEASDYTYGTAGNHVIIAGRYGVRTPAHNHIEVFAALNWYGIPTFGDEVNYDEINLVGHRLQKIYDYSYTSDAECDARAVAQLRKHNATTKRGQITTLPNVGLQLFDVLTVTDARAGISAEVYRVRGIEETFDTTKSPPIYRQIVDLGAR